MDWIPIEKELPIISDELINEGFNRRAVLITDLKHDMVQVAWYDIEDDLFYDNYDIFSNTFDSVVAWMPLPKMYNK